MVGSLLNQVSAEMSGSMMMRLMIMMMIFFCILCLRIYPNLKFYLLLLIFSRDCLRAYSYYWHSSVQRC